MAQIDGGEHSHSGTAESLTTSVLILLIHSCHDSADR